MKFDDRAFTLAELLVSLLILSMLLLLAVPKFLSVINTAKELEIVNNIKLIDDLSQLDYIKHNKYFFEERIPISKDYMRENLKLGNLYDINGRLKDIDLDEKYYLLEQKNIKKKMDINLKGRFIMDEFAKIIYLDSTEDVILSEYINYKHIEKYSYPSDKVNSYVTGKSENRKVQTKGNRYAKTEDIYFDQEKDYIYVLLNPNGSKKIDYEGQEVKFYYNVFGGDRVSNNIHLLTFFVVKYVDKDTMEEISRGYYESLRNSTVFIREGVLELRDGRKYKITPLTVRIDESFFNFNSNRNIDRPIIFKEVLCEKIN